MQDIEPGTQLLSIPSHIHVRTDQLPDPTLAKLFEMVPTGSDTGTGAWQFRQALVLLWHASRGPASPLHYYLKMLPGWAPGVPAPSVGMVLPDELVAELQYAPLVADIHNHKWVDSQGSLSGLAV